MAQATIHRERMTAAPPPAGQPIFLAGWPAVRLALGLGGTLIAMNEQAPDANRPAYHLPALAPEAVAALAPRPGGVYLDGTAGEGGHSLALLEAQPAPSRVIGIDLDAGALDAARRRLARFGDRFLPVPGNYAEMGELAAQWGVGAVDGALLDLGFSSRQVDTPGYGLSFQTDEPLDMRYDRGSGPTAAAVVNNYGERELRELLRRFGEEPQAAAIARAIVHARPLHTTAELAALVERTVGQRPGGRTATGKTAQRQRPGRRIHPATRTFQALRIAVNGELDNLERGLAAALTLLRPGGRLAVISYHSLEDRIVKNFITREAASCLCPPRLPACVCGHTPRLRSVHRRVIRPAPDEQRRNPRSRSAKLRAAQRL